MRTPLLLLFIVLFLALAGCVIDAPVDGAAKADSAKATRVAPPGEAYRTFYLHGRMNVRAGPDTTHAILWKLERGDSIRMGPKDSLGWALIEPTHGEGAGYIWRKSNLVRSYPPPKARPSRRRRR